VTVKLEIRKINTNSNRLCLKDISVKPAIMDFGNCEAVAGGCICIFVQGNHSNRLMLKWSTICIEVRKNYDQIYVSAISWAPPGKITKFFKKITNFVA